jgi:hypothetical protein
MPVSISNLNVKSGESIRVTVNGFEELAITVHVTADGHCFVSGPMSERRTIFRLTKKGLTRARGMEDRVRLLSS